MIRLQGIKGRLSIDKLRKVSDLIYFDGPFLSHYVHISGDNYLSYWVDCDDTAQRWLVFRVGMVALQDYVNKRKTLYELLKAVDEDFVYVIDVYNDGSHTDPLMIFLENIPDDYFPEIDSYFDFSIEKSSDVASMSIAQQCGLFEIHFTGADVKYGYMPFDKYTKCLLQVDELRKYCASRFIKNRKESDSFKSLSKEKRAIELDNLRLDTNFEYVYSLAGSVRVLLRPQNLQVSFTQTTADDFARELIRLFKAGYSIEELKKYAKEYGQEALVKFNDLLETLKKNKVNIAVSWTNECQNVREQQVISEKDRQCIMDNLTHSIEHSEDLTLEGKFYSLNTRTGSFSFETLDEDKVSITGKFDDNVIDKVQTLTFEQLYEISVEKKFFVGLSSKSKPKFLIYDIKVL